MHHKTRKVQAGRKEKSTLESWWGRQRKGRKEKKGLKGGEIGDGANGLV